MATRGSMSSRDITPARQAAVYSPAECPMSDCGLTPRDISRVARAYSVETSPGSRLDRGPSSPRCRAARTSKPRTGSRMAAHRSSVSRKTGSVSYRPRPMPSYCAPPPGNRKATGRSVGPSAGGAAWPGAPSCATAPSRSRQTAKRRCAKVRRPERRVCATSPRARSGVRARWSPNRAPSRSAASADLADQGSSTQPSPVPRAGAAGGSSRTAWAFVPPMPKELTPARRGVGPAGHSVSRSLTWNGEESRSMSGFGEV